MRLCGQSGLNWSGLRDLGCFRLWSLSDRPAGDSVRYRSVALILCRIRLDAAPPVSISACALAKDGTAAEGLLPDKMLAIFWVKGETVASVEACGVEDWPPPLIKRSIRRIGF